MTVEIISEATTELRHAMDRLLPQLSNSAPQLTEDELDAFIKQPNVYLFVFRAAVDKPILGMLTLATFAIPTGLRAWIEDVVVDEGARGQGAGSQLVEAAITHALYLGARTVDLTSRPSREAANRLYQRSGFELRETNVYRYSQKQAQ